MKGMKKDHKIHRTSANISITVENSKHQKSHPSHQKSQDDRIAREVGRQKQLISGVFWPFRIFNHSSLFCDCVCHVIHSFIAPSLQLKKDDYTADEIFMSVKKATCCVHIITTGANEIQSVRVLCHALGYPMNVWGLILLRCGFMTRWHWACTLLASLLISDLNDLLQHRQMEEGRLPTL